MQQGTIIKVRSEDMKQHVKNGNFYLFISFVVMLILFLSSSQTYEEQSSLSFLEKWLAHEPFKQTLSSINFNYGGSEVSIHANGYFQFIEFFIRKGAHLLTYFLLGGSFFLGLYPKLKIGGLTLFYAWFSATGYAAFDEFHQMLTGGRTPLFQDVMLDSVGAFVSCTILVVWVSLGRKKR